MRITNLQQRRRSVQLATRVLDAVERAGAHYILLTSVAEGEGKTELADALRLGLTIAGYEHFRVIHWRDLPRIQPHQFPADMLVFIDGPAMFEGADVLSIPAAWRGAIDGSLLVVMKRVTRRQEVEEAVEWLRAAGHPVFGAIWNDYQFPSLRALIERFRAKVQPPTRGEITANLPWGEMARQQIEERAAAANVEIPELKVEIKSSVADRITRQTPTPDKGALNEHAERRRNSRETSLGAVAAGLMPEPINSEPPMPPPSEPPAPFDERRGTDRRAAPKTSTNALPTKRIDRVPTISAEPEPVPEDA